MSAGPTILFAPVLRAEGWTSIDLQQRNILEALQARADSLRIVQLRPPQFWAGLPLVRPFYRDHVYPQVIRRAAAKFERCVLHVSDHSYGHLCRVHSPCIANCNDLHHLVQPELESGQLARWKKRVMGLCGADRVLAISSHLAGEIHEHLRIPAERVTVIHGGVDHAVFRQQSPSDAAAHLPGLAALRDKFLLILNVGSNIPRKNLPTLLHALHLLTQKYRIPVKLVKIGPPLRGSEHQELISALGIDPAIVDLGQLEPRQVAAACQLTHALSFPSRYEGFGRPTVEAQACGLPCVLADASCLREIGGAGALYHPPANPEILADRLKGALTDATIRSQLIVRGLENARRFSWTRYGDQLATVYQEISR